MEETEEERIGVSVRRSKGKVRGRGKKVGVREGEKVKGRNGERNERRRRREEMNMERKK